MVKFAHVNKKQVNFFSLSKTSSKFTLKTDRIIDFKKDLKQRLQVVKTENHEPLQVESRSSIIAC